MTSDIIIELHNAARALQEQLSHVLYRYEMQPDREWSDVIRAKDRLYHALTDCHKRAWSLYQWECHQCKHVPLPRSRKAPGDLCPDCGCNTWIRVRRGRR